MRLSFEDIQKIAEETEKREIEIFMRLLAKDSVHYQEYLDSYAFGDWDDDGYPGDR